jgi:hydrogenase nickel incorporation protein HypA/HybF
VVQASRLRFSTAGETPVYFSAGETPAPQGHMHELSIVEALIDQVQQELDRAGQRGRVLRLDVSIGRLSGVNPDSIRFAFGLLTPGTVLDRAEMSIKEPKPVCRCRVCNAEVEIDDLVMQCPQCAADEITIEGGRDMMLQSIEIEES